MQNLGKYKDCNIFPLSMFYASLISHHVCIKVFLSFHGFTKYQSRNLRVQESGGTATARTHQTKSPRTIVRSISSLDYRDLGAAGHDSLALGTLGDLLERTEGQGTVPEVQLEDCAVPLREYFCTVPCRN